MNFKTSGHEVEEKVFVAKFLSPGIHIARIQKIEYKKSQGGTEGIEFTFEGKPMEELEGKGQTANTTYWLSAKAWPFTKDRLTIMADKLKVREAFDTAGDTAEDTEAYVNAVSKVFAGKSARWKFAGKEALGGEKEDGTKYPNKFWPELAGFKFIEELTVTDADSKLTFDENDKWDMQRLAPSDVEASTSNGESFEDTEESPW